MTTTPAPDPTVHYKKIIDGEIEVCAGCFNSLGYNVAWEFADPEHIDPATVTEEPATADVEGTA